MGTIQFVSMAVYMHEMQSSVCDVWARMLVQQYATAKSEWSPSFVTLFFPPDRNSAVICIQHLRLWMFNAAIKLISDIKCICD